MRPGIGLLAFMLLSGCVQKISIVSDPVGAQVRVGRRDWGTTPVDVRVWSIPFRRPVARLSFPGYRGMEVDLGPDKQPMHRLWELLTFRWGRAVGRVPAGAHEVILIVKHGPAGSWTTPEGVE